MGGADIGRQYITAGLVDEIKIHLAPVLFGSGTRMFQDIGDGHLQLETVDVAATPAATHPRYSVAPEPIDQLSGVSGAAFEQ